MTQATSTSNQLPPNEFLSLAMASDVMAVDTETNGKDIRDGQGFAIGISAAVLQDDVYYSSYFPVAHTYDNVSDTVKDMLFGLIASRNTIVFHNAKFDLVSMETAGYRGGYKHWYCTMLMAHMLNENIPKGLDWLARNELKEPGKNKPMEWVLMHEIHKWDPTFPPRIMALYAGEDAVLTLKLFYKLYPFFLKSGFDGAAM